MEEVLNIGDVKIFSTPVVLKCHGLGSCIGLFVKDRATGITGGAHIFLPYPARENNWGAPASDAVELMLDEMKRKGASLATCRAKIAGGSDAQLPFTGVGVLNTQEVVRALIRNKIMIAAMDVGGAVSRTVKFDTTSGEMVVRQVEWNRTRTF